MIANFIRLFGTLGILFISTVLNTYAQKFEANHIDYSYGLSNSQVLDIQQDENGFIWMGTNGGGVYRWDGQNLKPLNDSLKYENTEAILPGPEGIWLSTYSNFLFVDNTIDTLPVSAKDEMVYYLYHIANKVVSVTGKGLINVYEPDDQMLIDSLRVDDAKEGKFNIFKKDDVLYLFTYSSVYRITIEKNSLQLRKMLDSDRHDLARDGKLLYYQYHSTNDGWIYQDKDSLYFLDTNLKVINKVKSPFKTYIQQFQQFKSYYWLGTLNGLYQCEISKGIMRVTDKVMDYPVSRILATKDNLWVGSVYGLFDIHNPIIYLIEENDEIINTGYFGFEKVNDEVWAASIFNGVHIYKEGQLVDTILFKNERENATRCVFDYDDEYVLVGTSYGIMKVDKRTKAYTKLENLPFMVNGILRKNEDTLYLATRRKGLVELTGDQFTTYQSGSRTTSLWSILQHGNQLYLGSEDGLKRFDGDKLVTVEVGENYDQYPVTSIDVVNDSVLAVGYAQKGVILYNTLSGKIGHTLNEQNLLSSGYVYFLRYIDKALWVGTSLGVDVITFNNSGISSIHLKDYAKVAGAETNLDAIITLDSVVWASTITGTISIPRNITSLENSKTLYPVIIERVEPLSFAGTDDFLEQLETNQNEDNILQIPYGHGSIKILFNSADFSNREVNFVYQLKGYDPEPNEATENKFATYKQLPPGAYEFEVWRDGNRSDLASVRFQITTPFYRKEYFKASVFIVVATIIILTVWYQSNQKSKKAIEREKIRQQAQNELRKEMAIDFHDEMGNHLAKIINLSGVLKLQGVPKKQEPVVSKIEDAARELFNSTKDLIWSLKRENNNLEEIFFHIKDFSDQLFDKTSTNVRLYKSEDFSRVFFNPKASRDLSLIIKEAVTNIYKHAYAQNVSISFLWNKKSVLISITDDGVGFSCDRIVNRNGLKNMQQRAARSEFAYKIKSQPNKGTEVKLEIS